MWKPLFVLGSIVNGFHQIFSEIGLNLCLPPAEKQFNLMIYLFCDCLVFHPIWAPFQDNLLSFGFTIFY